MPYFVYILLSRKDRKLYVGCSNNIDCRILDHNQGKVRSTKNRRPLVLIYLETIQDKSKAFNRERFFKSLWSAKMKRKILRDYLNKVGHK